MRVEERVGEWRRNLRYAVHHRTHHPARLRFDGRHDGGGRAPPGRTRRRRGRPQKPHLPARGHPHAEMMLGRVVVRCVDPRALKAEFETLGPRAADRTRAPDDDRAPRPRPHPRGASPRRRLRTPDPHSAPRQVASRGCTRAQYPRTRFRFPALPCSDPRTTTAHNRAAPLQTTPLKLVAASGRSSASMPPEASAHTVWLMVSDGPRSLFGVGSQASEPAKAALPEALRLMGQQAAGAKRPLDAERAVGPHKPRASVRTEPGLRIAPVMTHPELECRHQHAPRTALARNVASLGDPGTRCRPASRAAARGEGAATSPPPSSTAMSRPWRVTKQRTKLRRTSVREPRSRPLAAAPVRLDIGHREPFAADRVNHAQAPTDRAPWCADAVSSPWSRSERARRMCSAAAARTHRVPARSLRERSMRLRDWQYHPWKILLVEN